MNREEVEKIGLGKPESTNLATNKPMNFPVIGLPEHLEARIVGTYKFHLSRKGDILPYSQNQPSPTPEAALLALKRLLNWDPA
jgi:hypothetical protein